MNTQAILSTLATGALLTSSPSLYAAAPQQPATPPSVLLFVVDDLGYSDLAPFGGEIHTPHIQQLANRGVIYNNFHASSFSAPTRAMLLTGVDNHQSGFGNMPDFQSENQYGKPAYYGYLNSHVKPLPLLLRENNYHTFMTGKWHLGEMPEKWPVGVGFDKSFAMLAGGSSHFHKVMPPMESATHCTYYVDGDQKVGTLDEDFYSTRAYADRIIDYIKHSPAGMFLLS